MAVVTVRASERAGRGPIDGLDPRTRVLLAIGFAVAVAAQPDLLRLALALAAALASLGLSRHPPGALRRRLAAVEGLVLLVVCTLPFTVPGEPVATLGPLTLSEAGLARAASVALRANAISLAVLGLLGTLDVSVLARTLAQLRVPGGLVQTVAFAARYLSVLEREVERLHRSVRARGFRPRSTAHGYRTLGYLIGALVVRAFERAERVLDAMRCRGFDGRFLPVAAAPLPGRDRVLLTVAAVLLLAFVAGGAP
ncbi:MAG: cobalt ECF transporter T component CbiQ [Trueperaceae bacterium]|nr:cobalt ECF transporter T component CbiQ [Trueperaceae bacterium]